jgi:hypothetical protein
MPLPKPRTNFGVSAILVLTPCLLLLGALTPPKGPDDPCKLFTQAEIKAVIGAAVEAGTPSIAGCQWSSADYESSAQIQIIEDTSYYEPHRGAKDYQELTGVGLYGWSAFEMDGWVASSNTGRFVLLTMVQSAKADRKTAIKFLSMLAERVK